MAESGLLKVAAVFVSIASVVYVGSVAYDVLAALAKRGSTAVPGRLINQSSASREAAHITFTNKSAVTTYQCVKGVVTAVKGSKSVESVEVCTGDVKPNSSITLEAPFPPGEVNDLCSAEKAGAFGTREEFSWDLCNFTTVDTTK